MIIPPKLPKLLKIDENQQYQIYALVDPRDNVARYIGISKDAMARYRQHLTAPCSRKTSRWIKDLGELGLHPIVQLLETIRRQADMSSEMFKLVVYEREAYWIDMYVRAGMPLLNTLGITRKYPIRGNIRPIGSEAALIVTPRSIKVPPDEVKDLLSLLPQSTSSVMTLAELIEEALMTNTEVAKQSGLSVGTVSRMVNGHPTSRLSVRKVLAVLSQKLGRKIDISEVQGLSLTD